MCPRGLCLFLTPPSPCSCLYPVPLLTTGASICPCTMTVSEGGGRGHPAQRGCGTEQSRMAHPGGAGKRSTQPRRAWASCAPGPVQGWGNLGPGQCWVLPYVGVGLCCTQARRQRCWEWSYRGSTDTQKIHHRPLDPLPTPPLPTSSAAQPKLCQEEPGAASQPAAAACHPPVPSEVGGAGEGKAVPDFSQQSLGHTALAAGSGSTGRRVREAAAHPP